MSKIIIYTKDHCPYCVRAKNLLAGKGLKVIEINITQSTDLQSECFTKSNGRKTVPQIFVGNTHIGGYNDLCAANESGILDTIVQNEGQGS